MRIRELGDYFLSKLLFIFLSILFIFGISMGYYLFLEPAKYQSSTSLILTGFSGENSEFASINTTDLTINQKLLPTYQEIAKSKKVLSEVISELNIESDVESLAKQITVTGVENTEIIKITVTDNDAKRAYQIVKKIASVFSNEVRDIYNVSNVSILDSPDVATKQSNMPKGQFMLLSLGAGMLVTFVVVFIKFLCDKTIKNAKQIENRLDIPMLGSIPNYNNKKKKTTDELTVNKNPKSSVAEAIRVVRTNIAFSLKLKKGKTILITSSVKGEGKSFVSANLATTFAQKNIRVLLVDSDLRLGRLHKIFHVSNKMGLSQLLVNDAGRDYRNYVRETKVPNLYFISRGMVPPNPTELLDSPNMQNFLKFARNDFDIILFDGTPIQGLTDSLVFTKYVDKVVAVSAVNYTKMPVLEDTIKVLKNLNVDVAGIILNKVPNSLSSAYYGEYYTK